MVPRLWGRERLYSLRMINWHFWLATLGIVVYAAVMWVAGISQGLMWREYSDQGFLVYSFAEVVAAMHPYYVLRMLGGMLYLAGMIVMAINVYLTIKGRIRNERPLVQVATHLSPAE